MAKEQFKFGDPVAVKAGEQFEEFELDMSGWQGRVADFDDDEGLLQIVWDSQTLREMPEWAIERWIEAEIDWTSLFVQPDILKSAPARDKEDDWITVARERFNAYGIDMDEVVWNPFFDDFDFDEEDDEFFEEEYVEPFNLAQFLAGREIPEKEHETIRRCLGIGLEKYYHDLYGYNKYGKRPEFLIEERMQEPYIFGYGALEVIQHKHISKPTKFKVCQHVLNTMNPDDEYGVPYGLLTLLGFLATENNLPIGAFLMSMLALEYGGVGMFRRPPWTEGATQEALIALADWIAAHGEMPESEKTWWIWRLTINCEYQPHLGKALADHWLDKPEISAEAKRELCWGWLTNDEEVGTPPLAWRLMAAHRLGDLEQIKQILEEAGIDPEQAPLPGPEEMPPAPDEGTFGFLRHLLRGPRFIMTPGYLTRLAIPALVRFGEELEGVAETVWNEEQDYYADAKNNGVADAIEEFHDRLPAETLRRLIERGIQHSRATTRKPFYALSTKFYGNEYLEQALKDNAGSIRTWARKKLKKG
ncbi:MAG TPA: hypothetical protein VF177_08385 [Anaerolineae bacterium]